jgi:hypothetical protein
LFRLLNCGFAALTAGCSPLLKALCPARTESQVATAFDELVCAL